MTEIENRITLNPSKTYSWSSCDIYSTAILQDIQWPELQLIGAIPFSSSLKRRFSLDLFFSVYQPVPPIKSTPHPIPQVCPSNVQLAHWRCRSHESMGSFPGGHILTGISPFSLNSSSLLAALQVLCCLSGLLPASSSYVLSSSTKSYLLAHVPLCITPRSSSASLLPSGLQVYWIAG